MNGRTIKFVGLSNHRTVGLSNSGCRTIEPSDYRSVPLIPAGWWGPWRLQGSLHWQRWLAVKSIPVYGSSRIKRFLKVVELAGIWKDISCMLLDKSLGGTSLLVGSILTRLLLIWYSNTSLACLLWASNDVHCSWCNISVTDEVLWYLFLHTKKKYLAARLCSISRLCLLFCW